MPVRTLKTVKPKIWIPPQYTTLWKVVVVRADGTEDDVTSLLSRFKVEDYVTESVGLFELEIYDPQETYVNAWVGNEIIYYYKDYATSATTLRFRGRLEKPSKTGHKLKVKGRSESLKLINLRVTKSYNNVECSVILKDLFSSYVSWATVTGVEATNTFITVDWYERPFMECVQELCNSSLSDFYVNANLVAQFFVVGSRKNTTDAVIHNSNMLSLTEFSPDHTQIRNVVRVYGSEVDGIQTIYTARSSGGSYGYDTDFGERIDIVRNDNITTFQQAKDLGDARLAELIVPPQTGEITGFILAGVSPGDQVRLSSPADGIIPGYYSTSGYKEEINLETNKFSTTLYINKTPRTISHVIAKQIEKQNKTSTTPINPFSLDYTYNFDYNLDNGSHSDTQIINGVLKLDSGQSTGFWISDDRETTANISDCYLKLVGTNLDSVLVYVSGNNGLDYEPIHNYERISLSGSVGKNLVVKVEFTATGSEIDSLSVMYK